jgi:hypothetical protein
MIKIQFEYDEYLCGKYHKFMDMSNTEVLTTEQVKTPETTTEVLTTGLVQKTRGLTLRF